MIRIDLSSPFVRAPRSLSLCLAVCSAIGCYAAPDAPGADDTNVSSITGSGGPLAGSGAAVSLTCGADKFWFDGACRARSWVRSTFTDASHPGVMGGFGTQVRSGSPSMVLVESEGDELNATGHTLRFTVIASSHIIGPMRGGYSVTATNSQNVAWIAAWTRSASTLTQTAQLTQTGTSHGLPTMGLQLVTTDWSTQLDDYAAWSTTTCNASGCSYAIASGTVIDTTTRCADIVARQKSAQALACEAFITSNAAELGCLGGMLNGAAGAPVSLGLSIAGGCLVGGVAGTAAGVSIARNVCEQIVDVMTDTAGEESRCVAELNDRAGAAAGQPPSGTTLTQSTSGGSGASGGPCSGMTVRHFSGVQVDGYTCEGDVEFECSGSYNSSGQCVSDGNCSVVEVVPGTLACVGVSY